MKIDYENMSKRTFFNNLERMWNVLTMKYSDEDILEWTYTHSDAWTRQYFIRQLPEEQQKIIKQKDMEEAEYWSLQPGAGCVEIK